MIHYLFLWSMLNVLIFVDLTSLLLGHTRFKHSLIMAVKVPLPCFQSPSAGSRRSQYLRILEPAEQRHLPISFYGPLLALILYDWLFTLFIEFSHNFAYFYLSLWPAKNSIFCGFLSYVCSNADRICKVRYLKVQKFFGRYFHVDDHNH